MAEQEKRPPQSAREGGTAGSGSPSPHPPSDTDAEALSRLGRDLAAVQERQAGSRRAAAERSDPRSMRQVGKAWSLAIEMVAAVGVCVFIGWWVDRWLGSAPWGLLGFILLGIATAMWTAIRTAMRMQAQQQADDAAAAAGEKTEGD
ncbi:MAG TPA: AtpZ/AtpI family protein [Ferrovibrio sp.]|jgi:ATP synthase protein I|uniref:AtpZ/AtpI family protein n=1 Tax=Ferrovibrio sp. TaxID=1917215 RepID=UPI002ED0EDD5